MNEPIKALKREGPFVSPDDLGDCLFGEEYIYPLTQEELQKNDILLLIYFAYNGWNALKRLNIDFEELKKDSSYEDTFTKVDPPVFSGIYPIAIMSNDASKYRLGEFKNSHYDIAFDMDWTKNFTCKGWDRKDKEKQIVQIPISHIADAYMGHGYTYGTLPDDGGTHTDLIKVRLSNGDWLICRTWLWYNK